MRLQLGWSILAVAASVTTAGAQQAPGGGMQQGIAGSWNVQSMVGPKDSVVVSFVMTFAPDGKSATIAFPNREPITARVLAMGGDSVVTEAGPYPSILRSGQTVNSLRTVSHYKGDAMMGTFEAHYAGGDVLKGKSKGTRAK